MTYWGTLGDSERSCWDPVGIGSFELGHDLGGCAVEGHVGTIAGTVPLHGAGDVDFTDLERGSEASGDRGEDCSGSEDGSEERKHADGMTVFDY